MNDIDVIIPPNEHRTAPDRRLGRLPARSDTRALMFARFSTAPKKLPKRTNYWTRKTPFAPRTFGNTQWGNCTIAKQAIAALRMERIETRRLPVISDQEVIDTYRRMVREVYGSDEDNGAYETDALSNWRKADKTFKDERGRSLTIDAFTRINHLNHEELKQAIWTAGAHGIAVCLNLPWAFESLVPHTSWHIPITQEPTGEWMAGSWGGHSMWARDYDEEGIWLTHTWGMQDQLITWRAASIYLDEAHLVIDSFDYWRKAKPELKKFLDFDGIKKEVNKVSPTKIK